jgi:hypothetical protein
LSPDQKILFNISLPLSFTEKSFEMNFVKELTNGAEQDVLWVVCNTNKYVVKINQNGEITKRYDLTSIVSINKCDPFQLTTKGQFTDYDIKRKFQRTVDGKIINSDNPAFGIKMNLNCGGYTEYFQSFCSIPESRGWTHFCLTHQIVDNSTVIKLYINGTNRLTKYYGTNQNISNIKTVNFGTKVSPFIIGGTSGKLGANNLERSLEGEYLVGKFNELRIYQRTLNDFEILALSNHQYYNGWRDLLFYSPTDPYTCIEKINFFHLNRPPGHKSNKFNIKIKGFTDPSLRENVTAYILSNINKFKPAHTILNDIIFE